MNTDYPEPSWADRHHERWNPKPSSGGTETNTDIPWGDLPYDSKTPAEVVHDFAVIRGDLSEQYARDQLANWIERYAAQVGRESLDEVERRLSEVLWLSISDRDDALSSVRAVRDTAEPEETP
jgi:hypothetical protein